MASVQSNDCTVEQLITERVTASMVGFYQSAADTRQHLQRLHDRLFGVQPVEASECSQTADPACFTQALEQEIANVNTVLNGIYELSSRLASSL